MQRYALLDSETQTVMRIVVWDGVSTWQVPADASALLIPSNSPVEVGWRYLPATNSFLRAGPNDPTTAIRRMEKIDFMRLFTTMEMVRYKMLRMRINNLTPEDYTDAMMGDAVKMLLVQADVFFDRFDLASQVEMDHAETVMAVDMLAQAGIFGQLGDGEADVTQEYIDDRVSQVLAGLMPGAIPVDEETT